MAMAIAALEASRGLLRHEMLPPPAGARGRAGAGAATGWRGSWRRLRRWLKGWPVGGLAAGTLHEWWRAHPFHPVGDIAAAKWRSDVVPVVHRHPLLSVTLAAGAGALVVIGKPWRWPLVARQLKPMPSRIGRWLMVQLSSVPVQTALATLAVMVATPADPPETDGDPAEGADIPQQTGTAGDGGPPNPEQEKKR